jgi:leucyl aminopeptidase (aminopeptidase T)
MNLRILSLLRVVEKLVKICGGVKANENVVILTDTSIDSLIPSLFGSISQEIGATVTFVARETPERPHSVPPKPIAGALKSADIIFDISRFDSVHTVAVKEAILDYGARFIGISGTTQDMLLSPKIAEVDYEEGHKLGKRIAKICEIGKTIKYATKKGTSLMAGIEGMKWYPETGVAREPGHVGIIPMGEVLTAPVHGTANGVCIFDLFQPFGRLKEPIKITVEKGWATKVEGGEEAIILRRMWNDVENANYIGEIGGIGLNPKCELTGRPDALEESMKLGSVHIGFGDSLSYGGEIYSKMHLNGVLLDVTIEIDGKAIIDRGELLV